MLVDVISMIASVGSSITGSGTLSPLTSRFPCQVTAFICIAPSSAQSALPSLAIRERPPIPAREARSRRPHRGTPLDIPQTHLHLFHLTPTKGADHSGTRQRAFPHGAAGVSARG